MHSSTSRYHNPMKRVCNPIGIHLSVLALLIAGTAQAQITIPGNNGQDGVNGAGSGAIGERLTITSQVRNGGEAPAAAPWQDCLYLSTDDTPGNDVSLVCQEQGAALAVSAVYGGETEIEVPQVAPGIYWILLVVDTEYAVREDNEENNWQALGPITILPPLVPTSGAVSTLIPSFGGDGLSLEIFLGIGGGAPPQPDDLEGLVADGQFYAPYLDFPNPGSTVSISSSFNDFFAATATAPDVVQALQPQRFILRSQGLLRVTDELDLDPATPEIDMEIGVGSDDGYYLEVTNRFQGITGDSGIHGTNFASKAKGFIR